MFGIYDLVGQANPALERITLTQLMLLAIVAMGMPSDRIALLFAAQLIGITK